MKSLYEKRKYLATEIQKMGELANEEGRTWGGEDEEAWKNVNEEYNTVSRKIRLAEVEEEARADEYDPVEERGRFTPGLADYDGSGGAKMFGGDADYSTRKKAGPITMWDARGNSMQGWRRDSGSAVAFYRSNPREAERLHGGGFGREFDRYQGLTLGGWLRSIVTGPRSDVEQRALTEGTDSQGGFTVPTILAGQVVDALRAESVVLKAGAILMPVESETTTIARIADPTPAWRAESGVVAESDASFTGLTLTPESLAVLSKVSEELLEDAVGLEAALTKSYAAALAEEIDRAALEGTGVSNQPTGLNSLSPTTVAMADTALTRWQNIIELVGAILANNGRKPTDLIMAPRTWDFLASLEDTINQPIPTPTALTDVRLHVTSGISLTRGVGSASANLYAGGFENLVIAIRAPLIRMRWLNERYADTMQKGLLVGARVDVGALQALGMGMIEETTS